MLFRSVEAWITLRRDSNSTDPDGVMTAVGSVNVCKNPGCATWTTLGSAALGSVTPGTRNRLYVSHDTTNHAFTFQLGTSGTPSSVTYTVTDSAAPGDSEKYLAVRTVVPNCSSAMPPLVTRLLTQIGRAHV